MLWTWCLWYMYVQICICMCILVVALSISMFTATSAESLICDFFNWVETLPDYINISSIVQYSSAAINSEPWAMLKACLSKARRAIHLMTRRGELEVLRVLTSTLNDQWWKHRSTTSISVDLGEWADGPSMQEKNNNTLKRTDWGESKRTMEHCTCVQCPSHHVRTQAGHLDWGESPWTRRVFLA